jgi:hypothetical protein
MLKHVLALVQQGPVGVQCDLEAQLSSLGGQFPNVLPEQWLSSVDAPKERSASRKHVDHLLDRGRVEFGPVGMSGAVEAGQVATPRHTMRDLQRDAGSPADFYGGQGGFCQTGHFVHGCVPCWTGNLFALPELPSCRETTSSRSLAFG